MGRFVEFEIEAETVPHDVAVAVVRTCPVDIFALDQTGSLVSRAEREDECILCGRCVALAADGVTVRRAYGARRHVFAAVDDADA